MVRKLFLFIMSNLICKELIRIKLSAIQCSWNLKKIKAFSNIYSLVHVLVIPPANEVAGVYSDPYVRPFVCSSVRPSQSLIRYSSKTAEQNFMKLSGIVHYMMPYCTSYFKFLSAWFWVSQTKQGLCHTKHGGAGGIILWAVLTVFLVFH